MRVKIGTIEPCPGQTIACKGSFTRGSAAQIRCRSCTNLIRKEQKRASSRKLYLQRGHPQKGENMSRVGTVELCPGSSEACEGTFVRKSGFQSRCKPCAKQVRRNAAREYQRQKRGYYEEQAVLDREEKKIKYGGIKEYPKHPCWCCGGPTTNRALCNGCYENNGRNRGGTANNAACLPNEQIHKKEKEIRKKLKERVVVYSCKNMTQEELKKLVPSLNANAEGPKCG